LNGIELTDAQKTKVEAIQAKYQPEMQAIRESMQNGGDRAEAFQKMSALRDKMTPEIRAVLTPAQQAIYDKNLADQKARMEQMRQNRGPGR
jgi:Spy/CpxP family protein refolding chaperone